MRILFGGLLQMKLSCNRETYCELLPVRLLSSWARTSNCIALKCNLLTLRELQQHPASEIDWIYTGKGLDMRWSHYEVSYMASFPSGLHEDLDQ